MSELNQLLQTYCPNGVEYKKLGDFATISRGGNFQKKDFIDSGIPCIHYGQIYTRYGLFADKTFTFISPDCAKKQKMAVTNDIVMAVTSENIEDVCKCIAWLGSEPAAVSGHTAIIHHNQDAKYLVYYLHSEMFFAQKRKIAHGTKVIEVTPDKLNDIIIPLPPLEIQREIVRILDNFTRLTAELSAELSARQKQYSHYREKLLSFHPSIKWMSIGELCKNITSGGTPLSGISEYYNGNIPWLRTQEINWRDIYDTSVKITQDGLENSSAKWIPENCVIVAMYGATAAKCAINKIPLTTNQACCNLEIDKNIALYRYVFHWISKEYSSIKALGQGSQSNINAKIIKQYKIPVPPLDVQQRIVNVLDNFDAICSDLNIGLPAEISARQKQYEYYRDLLLSFKNIDNITDRQSIIKLLLYVNGFVWLELNDVIHSLNTGLNPRQFFKLNTDDATNYYITIREIHNGQIIPTEQTDRINDNALKLCNNRSNLEIDDVLFSGTGTIGETAVITSTPSNWNIKEGIYAIKPNQSMILPKFLRYLLMTDSIKHAYMKKAAGGTVKSVPMNELKKLKIPVPTIETQRKIVILLDRFDTLCNNLSAGLPAEIAARQQQYEYYRDKLLTFEEKNND